VPLRVEWTIPSGGEVEVPTDVRLAARFIGWGDASQIEGRVVQDGVRLEGTETTFCYLHEGPDEVHCMWLFVPSEPLAAESEVSLSIGVDGQLQRHFFTTGTGTSADKPGAPTAGILDRWLESTGERCEFDVAERYLFLVESADPSEDGLTLIHTYGDGPTPIHTITPGGGTSEETGAPEGMKQYLDAAEEHSGCFHFTEENAAGEESERTTICWEPEDSDPPESDPPESDPPDSPAESFPPDSEPADSEAPDDPEPPRDEGCGCGASAGLVLIGLVLLARRESVGG